MSVVPVRVIRVIWGAPEPRIAEPRVPEDACISPIPRVVIPSSPVPRIVPAPVSSVIPRIPVPAGECHRSIVCPRIIVVVDVGERVVRNGDRRHGRAVKPDDRRLVVRNHHSVFPVAEKQQFSFLCLCHKVVHLFVGGRHLCLFLRFRPVVDPVLIPLS